MDLTLEIPYFAFPVILLDKIRMYKIFETQLHIPFLFSKVVTME